MVNWLWSLMPHARDLTLTHSLTHPLTQTTPMTLCTLCTMLPGIDFWIRRRIYGLSLLVLYSARRGFSPGTLVSSCQQNSLLFDLICCDVICVELIWFPVSPCAQLTTLEKILHLSRITGLKGHVLGNPTKLQGSAQVSLTYISKRFAF